MQPPQPKRRRPDPIVVTIDDDDEQEAPAPVADVVEVKREAPEVPAHEQEERQEAVAVKQEATAADDEEQPDDQQENAPNAEEPDIQIKEEPEDGRRRRKTRMTKRNKKTVRNNQRANLQADLETVTVRLVEVKQENSGLKEVDQQREEEIAKLTDGLNERQAKIAELEQKVSKYAAKVAQQRNTSSSRPEKSDETRAENLRQEVEDYNPLFFYYDYQEHKAVEPIVEWLETPECEILLLRVKDGEKWAKRPPFDMPNCTMLVHRMDFRPVALQTEYKAEWMYDLVLYVKEDPDASPLCAFVRESFRQQRSLCEFLHEITKRLPQTVYVQSKALLLGNDDDRIRFKQFADDYDDNVRNSS